MLGVAALDREVPRPCQLREAHDARAGVGRGTDTVGDRAVVRIRVGVPLQLDETGPQWRARVGGCTRAGDSRTSKAVWTIMRGPAG